MKQNPERPSAQAALKSSILISTVAVAGDAKYDAIVNQPAETVKPGKQILRGAVA